MAKIKHNIFKKVKISRTKIYTGIGVFLFIILVGVAVTAIFFLNRDIKPIFLSNGDGDVSGVDINFDIEGFKNLGL